MTETREKKFDGTQFCQPTVLRNGKWVPVTPVAQAMLQEQRSRGNPVTAPWCEGEMRCK